MKVIINGILGLDGEWEIDGDFTNRDLNDIKKISGVRAGELQEATEAGDNDLVVAIAWIALRRNGKTGPGVLDALWDAPAGARITVDFTTPEGKEDDAGPPEQTPSGSPNEPGDASKSSGETSSDAGDHPEKTPPATGHPGSETTATSGPLI